MTARSHLSAGFLALFFVLLVIAVVGGFGFKTWLPPVASEHGAVVDKVIRYTLLTTGLVFVVGHLILAFFIVKYSRDERGTAKRLSPGVEARWALSVAFGMSIIAEVGVLVIGMPAWAAVYGEPSPDDVVVEVVAQQFGWFIRYPGKDGKFGACRPELIRRGDNPLGLDKKDPASADDIIVEDELRLPVNKPARIVLRSLDVLHSFSVPEMRVKQDIIPGYTGRTRFVPNREGTYEIACAELCGLGHYKMRGLLQVMAPQDLQRWLSEQVPAITYIVD
ncbi:MAG: cytochrome-c oxidase [Planctomycetota bacterium]|nr:cytochrome-c oxidase [Planctomycetota bacterium]